MPYSPRRRILRDITSLMMQEYMDGYESPPPRPEPMPVPRVAIVQIDPPPVTTQLRYEQPAPWNPITPPSTGRGTTKNSSLSPLKGCQTPTTSSSPRTSRSPRKRLMMTPEKNAPSAANSPKRLKMAVVPQSPPASPPLESAIKGLSHDQLVSLVQTLANESADLRMKIAEILPLPDLHVLNDELKHLRTCVQQSLPSVSSRIISKTNAVAFSRAQAHINILNRFIFQTAGTLVKSEHWTVVVDFVFLAWNQMRLTPNWDHDIHNDLKRKCYRVLSAHLGTALKNGEFSADDVIKISEQVHRLASDSPSMEACRKLIQSPKFKV